MTKDNRSAGFFLPGGLSADFFADRRRCQAGFVVRIRADRVFLNSHDVDDTTMTMRLIACTAAVSGFLFSAADVAVGQQVSIGGGTGAGATSGSGSGRPTGSSTTSTGSRATTSSATTGSGTSNSASGATAAGTAATGTTENVTNSAQNFIGGNALDTFIGGGLDSAANTNRNRQFRAVTETGTEGLSQAQQQLQGTPRSRTVSLRVGFPVASIIASASQLSAENAVSLESFVSVRPEFRAISASVSADGRVTLVGTTATSESRRLAANLIRLQPGVRRVDNQVVVTGN